MLSLDILEKAIHYVESQDKDVNGAVDGPDRSSKLTSSKKSPPESNGKQNGTSELHRGKTSDHTLLSTSSIVPTNENHRQLHSISKHSSDKDEQTSGKRRETMRLCNSNEVGSSDEAMSQYNHHHHSNGILPRLYADEKRRSTDSPAKSSPERKRSSSSHSAADSEPRPGLPQQFGSLSSSVTQPVTQVPAPNPMMPFVHPLMCQAFDPAMYADVLARQGLSGMSTDASRQPQSPASSPNTTSSSGSIQTPGLPRLMYPLHNPALFMGPRAAVSSGMGLADIPMVFPSQLAAYGQAASMLPQNLASYGALSDAEKRVFEAMATQPAAAHMLAANPYLKAFYPSAVDSPVNKNRSIPKPTVPTGVGLPSGMSPYTEEFLAEALKNEFIKYENASAAAQSSSPGPQRRSASPESTKKTTMPGHGLLYPAPFQSPYAINPSVTRAKSPIPDRKAPTPTSRPLKNGSGQPRYESRPISSHSREREAFRRDESHLNGDDAGRRLMSLAQRPQNTAPADLYSAHYKSSRDRRSPSPYGNDRWQEYRRTSREFSPHRSSAEKPVKKRSHEQYGIARDLMPDSKSRSPGAQAPIPGMRLSKSPPRGRSSSPSDRLTQSSVIPNPFSVLAGKSGIPLNEKDGSAYFAPPPYILHPALGGLTALPFAALPAASYLRQADVNSPVTNKAVAEALAASPLSAASPLFRPPVPAEAMSEYARLAGLSSPYVALLTPQQQQALRTAGMGPNTSTAAQDYAAVLKQATALQQTLLDSREKERLASPALAAMRPYFQNPASLPSKLARGSPNPAHHKHTPKHSSPYHLPPSSANLYTSHSRSPRGPQEPENRAIKRELSPSPGKRAANVVPNLAHPHGRPSNSQMNRPDEDKNNRLKRRVEEDDRLSKDTVMKRKREVTTDSNDPDIEAHFRRSLGNNYKELEASQNKVSITGSVDDHFMKALGNDVWSKVKTNSKSDSPDPTERVANGRENMLRTTGVTVPSSLSYPSYPSSYLPPFQAAGDARHVSPFPYNPHVVRNSAGNKMMKARGTVYPEIATDPPSTKVPNSTGPRQTLNRDDVTKKSAENYAEPPTLPPAYDRVVRSGSDPALAETASSRTYTPSSAFEGQVKKSGAALLPGSSTRLTAASPLSNEKSHGLNLSSSFHNNSTLASRPPPYNASPPTTVSHGRSPTRPPPAYSPHSSASASSLPPVNSPRRISVEGRGSEEPGAAAPMSVKT